MKIKATIRVDGNPLRRAYIEHIYFGASVRVYMTDSQGRIRDENCSEGIDSDTQWADVRIHCQNPVLRVLDGGKYNIGVHQDRKLQNGDVIDLDANAAQADHFAILNRMLFAYEAVFAPLDFFQDLRDPYFPLGRTSGLRTTRDKPKRIELSYPDGFPTDGSFVEPMRAVGKFPLIHLKDRNKDGRLFGDDGEAPTRIPGELAHALHFAFLTEAQRGRAQLEYGRFITANHRNGGGKRGFDVPTTAEIAYIEAGAHFATRFAEFLLSRRAGNVAPLPAEPHTTVLLNDFLTREWAAVTTLSFTNPISRAAEPQPFDELRRLAEGSTSIAAQPGLHCAARKPRISGGDVEGAVYAAIFVDFASRVGLNFAASSYFKANALSFGEYRNFIRERYSDRAAELEAVRSFWSL